MKKVYSPIRDGVWRTNIAEKSPSAAWLSLEQRTGFSRKSLRAKGYLVKMRIDIEESDALVAAEVIETIAPKPLKGIIGFFRRIFS